MNLHNFLGVFFTPSQARMAEPKAHLRDKNPHQVNTKHSLLLLVLPTLPRSTRFQTPDQTLAGTDIRLEHLSPKFQEPALTNY